MENFHSWNKNPICREFSYNKQCKIDVHDLLNNKKPHHLAVILRNLKITCN